MGFDIVRELSQRRYERYYQTFQLIGIIFLGLFFGYFAFSTWGGADWSMIALLLVSMAVTWMFVRSRKSIFWPMIVNISLLVGHSYLLG